MVFPYLSERPFITDTRFYWFYPPGSGKRYSSYGLASGTGSAFVNSIFLQINCCYFIYFIYTKNTYLPILQMPAVGTVMTDLVYLWTLVFLFGEFNTSHFYSFCFGVIQAFVLNITKTRYFEI